jgi:hypothetical protein
MPFWDVTPCGSCDNGRFGGTYPSHFRAKTTLAVTSNCSTLRRVNRYMRTEAIEWAVLHDERESEFLVTASLSSCLSVTTDI